MDFRVGQAFDAHRFAQGGVDPQCPLMLATVCFPDHAPLEGHSDGDVAAHALADALLSAAGLGDLGTNFGVDRDCFRGASGASFVCEVKKLLDEAGWRVVNASVQIIGQEPRFAAYYAEASASLSSLLGAQVSVSATTTDGMGFTGAGEGLAAQAVCLLGRF